MKSGNLIFLTGCVAHLGVLVGAFMGPYHTYKEKRNFYSTVRHTMTGRFGEPCASTNKMGVCGLVIADFRALSMKFHG